MAVIPQIVTSPGAVPGAPTGSPGGGQVRASPQMDIRAPTDPSQAEAAGAAMESQAYESEAHSAEKLAKYGEEFADKYVTAKLNIDAANRTADLSAKLHEAEFQSSKIADRDQATADFDARAGKIRDDFAAQDVNPRVRAAVDANLPNQIALRRASTQQAAFGLWSQAQVGQLVTNLDQYNKQAVDAQDPRLTEQIINQANQAIDGRVAGGALHADVAAKMKVDFGSNVYRTKVEVVMQQNMQAGIALYNQYKAQGKFNAADGRAMGVMAADRTKQVDAETVVNSTMPRFGAGGGGGDIGAVRSDAEKTLGFPLTITSADRTADRNQAVGGATDSQHLTPGKALDISLAGLSEEQKQKVYQQFLSDGRVGGIGFYPDHLHVDARGGPRATWGTPPAGVADQLKTWQASAPAAPTGDQLSQYKIDGYRYRQSIIDNMTMDPEAKARQLSIIDQRLSTTNAIVLEQRKSAADAADSAGQALYTGQYKPGTFQAIADQYRAAGDNSKADETQFLADREAQLIEDAKNPPEKESVAARLLPGAAGKIAAQESALKRAELADARAVAAQNRTANLKASAEQEKIYNDGITAGGDPKSFERNMDDAIAYAIAAGDLRKARALHEQYVGAEKGAAESKLPPAERERKKRELEEQIKNQEELRLPITHAQAEALKFHGKNEAANRERWEKDRLTATQDIGRIQLQPFDINMDPTNLQVWATKRESDLMVATASMDGPTSTATNLRGNFFTTNEMSDITQKLDGMRPQEAQQFLARLAVAVPQEAIALIGAQMSKKDPVSDSYAASLALYKRGQSGDIEIANRVITGMNWLAKGGPDGKTRIDIKDDLFVAIDDVLGKARAGMRPDDVRLQNNAIIADYVALTANNPDRKSIKTAELKQAITEIVGNTTTHNGASTILPREIEPYQFRNGVAAITAADVANLRPTLQGQPITAEVVRQQGQFVPTGDGKYNVVIPDPLRAARTVQLIDNNTNKPWEVDIKPLIARGVRGERTADEPDPLRSNQVRTPVPQPLVTRPQRPQPGGSAP